MKRIAALSVLLLVLFVASVWPAEPPLNTTHTTSFVVFPQDCNANPPMLFGGKLLAEMDRCAGVTVRRLLYASNVKDAVTADISVQFRRPAKVKDLVFLTGKVTKLGDKSINVLVEATRETEDGHELLAEGVFVFVACDVARERAAAHGLKLP